MISAIVLTRNSQERIQKCLGALIWCDEIVVVDDFSTDGTLDKIKGAKVYQRKLDNDFAAQRNFGLSKSTHDWILFVDDDEIVNNKLVQEIKKVVKSGKYAGHFLSRRDYFFGRFLSHGETASVKFLRLARKNSGVWERRVHENWQVAGPVGQLVTPLDHFPHQTTSDFLSSINQYTTIDAIELQRQGKPFSILKTILFPPGKFVQNYFLRLGLLDGMVGLIMAFMMSFYSLVVRIKQYDFSRNS